jgi:uncharacterized protein (DUF1778 family)
MARTKKPRLGRPVVAEADRRGEIVRVLVTADEHRVLSRAAANDSMSMSTWIRSAALARARVRVPRV